MLITLTTDFGVQSQGIGAMEATIYAITPEARVIHLMHGLPQFDLRAAARTMETVSYLPIAIHVCVCDPGVGTARRAIIIETERGDRFVGPDNGIFVPVSRWLGGICKAVEIVSPKYMRHPVSPTFHGRDVFAPAAAYLANGVSLDEFGPPIESAALRAAPYEDAQVTGLPVHAEVIQINRFGSVHLNIRHDQWDTLNLPYGRELSVELPRPPAARVRFGVTFGDVPAGSNVILKDDYGRVEIAKNLGSFVEEYPLAIGDRVTIR